jgi:hypothetical protein
MPSRARAANLSRLAASAAHLTTSAGAQKLEDQIAKLAAPTDEWDILYRFRLQAERDRLIGAKPGTELPGHDVTQER